MKLAEFKRLVEPGDWIRCETNEYIPDRAGQEFLVERVGPSVMSLRWKGVPYRFEWPKASAVVEVSAAGISYILTNRHGQFLVRHELLTRP